jgi:CBS domain containing-hemolysin-like protein
VDGWVSAKLEMPSFLEKVLDLSSAFGLVAVVVLVLANGFFVATEFALVAVRKSRLEQRADDGSSSAAAALDVVGHLDSYIAACQFGITIASLGLGWIGEPAFSRLIEPLLAVLLGSFAPAASHAVAVAVAFSIITGLHIVIGELAPKGLALQKAESTALWVARPMQVFYLLFRWPINVLNAIGNGTLRLAGLQPASGHEMVHSVEELRLLVTGMRQAGVVEASEARIVARAFGLGELTAGAIMTPRTELDAVPVTIAWPELVEHAADSKYARLLVYDASIDTILGAVHVQDIFRSTVQPNRQRDVTALLQPLFLVTASRPVDEILDDMRTTGRQMAVVLDEYGGTAGVVTLTNVVEALVGRIKSDEYSGTSTLSEAPGVQELGGDVVIDGRTRLGEFEEQTGLTLGETAHDVAETVGGLVMALLGRIPRVEDEVAIGVYVLRVEQMDARRVAVIRLLTRDQSNIAAATSRPQA